MNDTLKDEFLEKQTLPQRLNVLTILTFIGCAIFGLFTIFTPWILKFSASMLDKASSSGKDLTSKQIDDLEKGRAALELSQINMVPILILGLVGIILCFIGALMMRKLKKDGFWLYIAGQIVPLIGNFVLLGTAQFTSAWSYIGLAFPLLFIYLYFTQMKYFTK